MIIWHHWRCLIKALGDGSVIEKEKAINILEEIEEILYKKDWESKLREKIKQDKKEIDISFKVKK